MTDPAPTASPYGRLPYGTIVEIAAEARLIVGRPRNMATNTCDIANVVMCKVGTTLLVIDNGATHEHRSYLDKAADELRPFTDVVLVISHGHADHTGNNGWIDTLGVPARAYMSDHDLSTMRDQVSVFTPMFEALRPFMPQMPPARAYVNSIMAQFGEIDLGVQSLTFFEEAPIEQIEIGGTLWNGWHLLDGQVAIIQTSGHTQGHVAVWLPGVRHLHIADETTGYYQALLCGHAELNLLTLERAARLFEDGTAISLTDGHSFRLRRATEATAYLEQLSQSALAFDAAIVRILGEHPDGITVHDLVAQVEKAPEMTSAPPVAEPMPVLNLLRILNKVKELGIALPAQTDGLLAFPR